MTVQKFQLSLIPGGVPVYVHANQYDVGRPFAATILAADGSEYAFTTETVTICGTKPDGTGFSYDVTASGSTVTFDSTGQMTVVAGHVRCGIIITQDSTVIGTMAFILVVQPAALNTETIISSDDFGSIITEAVEEWMNEHGVVIDDTLTVAGAAADAAKVGEEIADLKSAFDLGCITPDIKDALLQLASKVSYIDEDGQDYYDALYDALYNRYWQVTNNLTNCTTSNESVQTIKGAAYSATITASAGYVLTGATVSITMGGTDITATAYSNGTISIPAVTGALVITISAAEKTIVSLDAVFTQGNRTIFSNADLDSLKEWLVVTASYDDSSVAVLDSSKYSLSGTLSAGTSTVTASAGSASDTFSVTVTAFTIPAGYTRYDYIKKKTTSNQNVAKGNFIILNDQTDMNALSTEMILGANTGFTGGNTPIWGVRNASAAGTSNGLYARYQTDHIELTGGYVNGVWYDFIATLSDAPNKFELIIGSESPAYCQLNGSDKTSIEWTNKVIVPHGSFILANAQYDTTANITLAAAVKIGDIILRKEDGECVGYYVPTVYDGKIGMYDIVSETFYTAATATAVTISNSGCLYAVGNWS